MNWAALGALGEAVGAVALLFVLVQVWHARQEMRRSIRQNRTDTLLELIRSQADSGRTGIRMKVERALGSDGSETPPFVKRLIELEDAGVTAEEALQIYSDLMMWWQYYSEKVIRYIDELSPADREQAASAMRMIFGGKTGQLFFEASGMNLNPDAHRYMQDLLNTQDD